MKRWLVPVVVFAMGVVSVVGEEAPEDVYYRGFLEVKKAEESEKEGKLAEALLATDSATFHYSQLAKSHPQFHPEIVGNRLDLLKTRRLMLVNQIRNAQGETALIEQVETLKKKNNELKLRIDKLEEALRKLQGENKEEDSKEQPKREILPVPGNADRDKEVPQNWKPRPFEGHDYYLVPLVETRETKSLTRSRLLGDPNPNQNQVPQFVRADW